MSKRVTRFPGDDIAPSADRGRRILSLRPRRTVETWKVDEASGWVVVTHPKALGALEARLTRLLRGSTVVNRPLDEYGSAIWLMCDGRHTVEEIARSLEERFRERFEPALPRTLKFVEVLAQRRLVTVDRDDAAVAGGTAP